MKSSCEETGMFPTIVAVLQVVPVQFKLWRAALDSWTKECSHVAIHTDCEKLCSRVQ